MSSEGTSPDSSVGIDRSRRQFIAAAGAAGALGLAGCERGHFRECESDVIPNIKLARSVRLDRASVPRPNESKRR